jgi:hypothetical protein
MSTTIEPSTDQATLPAASPETTPATSDGGSPQNDRAAVTGVAGAALGLGAGLVLAELVVPGVILAAVGVGAWVAAGRLARMIKRR